MKRFQVAAEAMHWGLFEDHTYIRFSWTDKEMPLRGPRPVLQDFTTKTAKPVETEGYDTEDEDGEAI